MRILIGVRSPDSGRAEIDLIASLRFRSGELAFVNVVEYVDVVGISSYGYPAGDFALEYLKTVEDAGAEALSQALAYARFKGFGEFKGQQAHGPAANELMAAAEKWDADLICAASVPTWDLQHFMRGSTIRKLVVGARQSLLLALGKQRHVWEGRAVFAVDHSEYTARCVDYLLKLAPAGLKSIRLLTAVPPRQMEEARKLKERLPVGAAIDVRAGLESRNAAIAKRLEPLGCKIESVVAVDEVHAAIAKEMRENDGADLLILGAQGHGFLERLRIGSTSLYQVTQAEYSILLLRPPVT